MLPERPQHPSGDEGWFLEVGRQLAYVAKVIAPMSEREFQENESAQDSVILHLILAGEAVKQLSQVFRRAHPGIPWKRIAGMRDIMIHRYIRTDLELVFDTAKHQVPGLLDEHWSELQ